MSTERTAFGLKAGEGKGSHQISFRGTKITVKVSKEDSEDRFTLLEIIHPPHVGPALHIHPDAPEAYYVLEGEYQIIVGKESQVGKKRQVYDVKTGDFVFIPKGLEHKYRSGPAGGKMLVISPAGLEKYFIEVADIQRGTGGTIAWKLEKDIAHRFGQDFIESLNHWGGQ